MVNDPLPSEGAMLVADKALEKAIEGGWRKHRGFSFAAAVVIDDQVIMLQEQDAKPVKAFTTEEAVLLDREFWLGLSEALGWDKTDVGRGYAGWADKAHTFLDLMLLGQDGAEKFWAEMFGRK
jgi:hypothetical protein